MQTNTAINPESITEFLSAYPFNTETHERDHGTIVLVSNLDTNFEIGFSPFSIDGEPADISNLISLLGGGEDIASDWVLHTERWPAMVADTFAMLHDRLEGTDSVLVNGEPSEPLQWADEANKISLETSTIEFELDSENPIPAILIHENKFVIRHPLAGRVEIEFSAE